MHELCTPLTSAHCQRQCVLTTSLQPGPRLTLYPKLERTLTPHDLNEMTPLMGYLEPFITGTDELRSTAGLLALQQLELAFLTSLTLLWYEALTGKNCRSSCYGD